MNVIRCKNGHFFDGDSYSTCPHCGEAAMTGGTAPAKEENKGFWGRGRKNKEAGSQPIGKTPSVTPRSDFGSGDTPTGVMEKNESNSGATPPLKRNPTLDFWQTPVHSENGTGDAVDNREGGESQVGKAEEKPAEGRGMDTTPISEPAEVKKEDDASSQEQGSSLREAVKRSSASNEGKTMSYFSSATSLPSAQAQPRSSAEPVVGWLVCVGGCHFGECFNIYAGKNSIGRSEENRIVIPDDNSISRIKHALIVYEPKKRNFYLQPGDSSGLTYLNEDYITESHKLAAQDMIELGDSKFMFVPLCGEAFSWEEYMPKGE